MADTNQNNKARVWELWERLENTDVDSCESLAAEYMSVDSDWHGPDPINDLQGPNEFVSGFWRPLLQSFPDLKRQTHIFMAGQSSGRIDGTGDGRMWVAGTGLFNGTFAKDYLTIPAIGKPVSIRWGEFCRVENDKIVETYLLLDFVDLMQQAGYEVLPPSNGIDGIFPPPKAGDGVTVTNEPPPAMAMGSSN